MRTTVTCVIVSMLTAGIQANAQELVFQSDFEGTTEVSPDIFNAPHSVDIVGEGAIPLSDWESDLENGSAIKTFHIGFGWERNAPIEFGTEDDRFVRIVSDPHDPENKVLLFCIRGTHIDGASPVSGAYQHKGKIESNFMRNFSVNDFFFRCRMLISEDILIATDYTSDSNYYFIISEFFGTPQVKVNVDNVDFSLNTNRAGDTRWKVPVGEWFTYEIWYSSVRGKFQLSVVYEGERSIIANFGGIGGLAGRLSFLKLYVRGDFLDWMNEHHPDKSMKIYYDDLEIWKNGSPYPEDNP